jgi:hypothetical protein
VRDSVIANCAFLNEHQQLSFGLGDLLNEFGRLGRADTFADTMEVQFDPA